MSNQTEPCTFAMVDADMTVTARCELHAGHRGRHIFRMDAPHAEDHFGDAAAEDANRG